MINKMFRLYILFWLFFTASLFAFADTPGWALDNKTAAVSLDDRQKQAQDIAALVEKSAQLYHQIVGIADNTSTVPAGRKMAQIKKLAQKASNINDNIIRLARQQDYKAMKVRFGQLEDTASSLTKLKFELAKEKERQRQVKMTEELERQKRLYKDERLLKLRKEEKMKTQELERRNQEEKRQQLEIETEHQNELRAEREEDRQAKIRAEAERAAERQARLKAEEEVKSEKAKEEQAQRLAKEEKRREEVMRQQAQEREEKTRQEEIVREESQRREELERQERKRLAQLETRRVAVRKQLEEGVEAMYRDALVLYKQGDYTAAADRFKDVQDILPGYKRSEQYMDEARRKSLDVKPQAVMTPDTFEDNVSKALDLFDSNAK